MPIHSLDLKANELQLMFSIQRFAFLQNSNTVFVFGKSSL